MHTFLKQGVLAHILYSIKQCSNADFPKAGCPHTYTATNNEAIQFPKGVCAAMHTFLKQGVITQTHTQQQTLKQCTLSYKEGVLAHILYTVKSNRPSAHFPKGGYPHSHTSYSLQ